MNKKDKVKIMVVVKPNRIVKISTPKEEKIIRVTAGISPQQLVLDTVIGCYFLM